MTTSDPEETVGLAHRTAVDAGKAAYSKSHLKLLANI